MSHLSATRLWVLGCRACNDECAAVRLGDVPDLTYGATCWADLIGRALVVPAHTHLDGHDHTPECEN